MADTHFSGVDTPILKINGTQVLGTGVSSIAQYTITWTANEPTAGDSATIADGDSPSVAETGQAIADLTAKVNAIISTLGLD